MSSQQSTPKTLYLKPFIGQTDVVVMDEILQKVEDPVAELKKVQAKVVVVVPNEYCWDPKFKPFTNPEHKRVYDTDMLSEHLQQAGLEPYILRQIDFAGWSFLASEAVRKMNSEERRRLRRAAERAERSSTDATPKESTSSSETASNSSPVTPPSTPSGDSHNEATSGVVGGSQDTA